MVIWYDIPTKSYAETWGLVHQVWCWIMLYWIILNYIYTHTHIYIYIYLSPLIQHCCGKVFSQPRLVDEDCSCWRQIPVNRWQITWMDRAGNCMKQTWPKKEQTGHFQTRGDKAIWYDCKSYETKRYTELENWEAALKQPESYNLNRLHHSAYSAFWGFHGWSWLACWPLWHALWGCSGWA